MPSSRSNMLKMNRCLETLWCYGLSALVIFLGMLLLGYLMNQERAPVAQQELIDPDPLRDQPMIAELLDLPAVGTVARLREKDEQGKDSRKPVTPLRISKTRPSVISKPPVLQDATHERNQTLLQDGDALVPLSTHGPIALHTPKPVIPHALRSQALKTDFIVVFHIASDGKFTTEVVQSTGHIVLDQVALQSLKQWKFFPARMQGTAVASEIRLKLEFEVL